MTKCNFIRSKENGHYHSTKSEADACKRFWENWSKPHKRSERVAYKPHGTAARDGLNYGIN